MLGDDPLAPHAVPFARLMFGAHPDWRPLAQEREGGAAFELSVPSPADPDVQLWLSTEDDELTVGFADWHAHFGWSDVPHEQSAREAFELIERLVTDAEGVQSFYGDAPGSTWLGSRLVSSTEGLLDGAEEYRARGVTFTRRRSWLGSLNADVRLD
ncbi:hypothetical protein [Deinococcus pimensis]|uniref:hypothetical protein n=1 Tax=Deinococcus pimensis TaxID=309888 RepID=UPI00048A404E|nr:hypothetical protein [Deinococcus pimensis]